MPLHLALACATDLSPDEAYYLAAARAPGALPPIVDHPPLLPWLLRLTDALTALPLEARTRASAVVFALVTTLACVALARRLGASEGGATLTAWAMTFGLLPFAGGFLATPDAPFACAIAVALFLASDGAQTVPDLGLVQRAIGVALAICAASLSKVSALPIALAISLSSAPRAVRAAALVGALAALPLLAPSLRFQLHHAFVQRSEPWSIGALPVALVAQLGLWSPWLLARGGSALRLRAPVGAVAATLTALVVASAIARGVPPEPNWWAPAAIAVVAAAATSTWPTRARRATLAWLLIPTAIAASHVACPWLPLPLDRDPTARLHGWRTPGHAPREAPGIGPYGVAAEVCVYANDCEELYNYFNTMNAHIKGSSSTP